MIRIFFVTQNSSPELCEDCSEMIVVFRFGILYTKGQNALE